MEILRAIEPDDLDLMYIVENDTSLWQYGSTTVPFSYYHLKHFLETSSNDIFADRQARFAIHKDNTTVGFLDVVNFSPLHHRAEVGIVLVPEAQHNGLACLALNEAAEFAEQCQIHQLYAIVSRTNKPAQNLFIHAGYSLVSTLTDWLMENGKYTDALLYVKTITSYR